MKKNDFTKQLNNIAVPLIIQNIACMLIGITDQMFLGRISTEAYGAIGITVSFMSLIAGVFGNIAVAFNIRGSKAKGEKDDDKFSHYLSSTIILDFFIGFIYLIFVFLFSKILFSKIYGLKEGALSDAVLYSKITCPYLILQLLIFTFNSYFKINKNTKRLMYVSTGATILNVVLDYIFIFGKFGFPKMGVKGAALSSILSLFLNAFVLLIFVRNQIHFKIHDIKFYKISMIDLLKSSIPLAGSELLEGSVFIVAINAIISHIGLIEISSYLLIDSLIEIVLISMNMYGSATMTLSSELLGKKQYKNINALMKTGITISMSIYVILCLLIIAFRDKVPMLISEDIELITFASTLIIPMVIVNFFNPVQTIIKYVLQSCEEANYVLYSTAIVNLLILLIILALYVMKFNLLSVFIGLFINYIVLAITYTLHLKKTIKRLI